jgi:MerR family transcriptional regulator, thiopeptide resistance regulator
MLYHMPVRTKTGMKQQQRKEIKIMGATFTPEQMEEIKERGRTIGQERISQIEVEWPALIEQVRVELDKGTDPSDPRVQELAKRWMGLVREFSGGNREIEKVLETSYREDPTQGGRLDPRMLEYMEYISRATAASGK